VTILTTLSGTLSGTEAAISSVTLTSAPSTPDKWAITSSAIFPASRPTRALTDARELGHAATLMFALAWTYPTQYYCGNYTALNTQAAEVVALADEKGSAYWKAAGMCAQGLFLYQTGRTSEAAQKLNSGIAASRGTGASLFTPKQLSWLAAALAEGYLLSAMVLSSSRAFASQLAVCSWLVLSCSIPCCTFARSRAIVWSICASSGDSGATVGAASCGTV
jgi:hypothetical protein